jgi:hypothetical protein
MVKLEATGGIGDMAIVALIEDLLVVMEAMPIRLTPLVV